MPEDSLSMSSVIASNTNLLGQILLCLPVKSLLVFKSISKQWLSLISDPIFIRNHCLRNRPSTPGLFLQKLSFVINPEFEFILLDGKDTISISFNTPTITNAGLKIEHSCNGLLCCSSFKMTDGIRDYYIYNPSTKHNSIIPGSSQVTEGKLHSICSVSLAFDPLKSPHYVAVRDWEVGVCYYRIEIYSSKTRSWRVSGGAFSAPYGIFSPTGIFWNDSLHWISLRENSLYFDINQELVKRMPMPPIPDGRDKRRVEYFGECRGHMHLIEMYGPFTASFDILEMEADYTRWNVKYRVDLKPLTIAYPEMVRDVINVSEFFYHLDYSVLLVEEQEEEDSSCSTLIMIVNNKVISYDLKEMSFKKILDLPTVLPVRYRWCDAYQYIETLADLILVNKLPCFFLATSTKLVEMNKFCSSVSVRSVSLAFDPLKSPHYDVVLIPDLSSKVLRVNLLLENSLLEDIWKFFPCTIYLKKNSGVFWNGSLHWITFIPKLDSLYFNIDEELMKEMPLHQIHNGLKESPYLYFDIERELIQIRPII